MRVDARDDEVDEGRGGIGIGELRPTTGDGAAPAAEEGPEKTDDNEGRDLFRESVGMVRRRADGLEEGVVGLAGGTL